MKNIILALTLLLVVKTASAQKDSLAIDDNNKYIYYQTVAEPGLNTDTLLARGIYFFKKAYPKDRLTLSSADKASGVLLGKGVLPVAKKALLSTHADGEIAFSARVEVKDAKYRYWFSDFVYTPYQRDRYNNYVPVPGIAIPLENAKTKLDAKDVDSYLEKILLNSRQMGKVLKSYMLKTSSLPKSPDKGLKKISTKEW